LAGSPAIDAGDNALAKDADGNALETDQRGAGFPRIRGDIVDIGAYESPDNLQTGPDFVVTTTADTDDSFCTTDDCTLREAINAANADADASAITFAPAVFNSAQTITLGSALPDLSTSLSIEGPGAGLLTLSGNTQVRAFHILAGQDVTISSLTVRDCLGSSGGAIYNQGNLSVLSCALVDNHGTYGGALCNDYTTPSKATVSNSTFSGNSTTPNGQNPDFGGAVFNGGEFIAVNSTFGGNSSGNGGAIANNAGTTTLGNCTVSGNSSSGSGAVSGSGLTLNNSIVAGNGGTGGSDVTSPSAINGDYNLIGAAPNATFAGTHNQSGISDPKLNALADNGGPTQTIALLAGSPAINAGDNALIPSGITTDQRGAGFPRIVGPQVDIGAYESPFTDTGAPINVTVTTPANGATVSALAAISGSASDNVGGSGIKSVSVVLHRYVSGSTQYWNGSAWSPTPSYLYPTLSDPGAVDTNWSLASNKLPSGANLSAGTYYLRAWAYDEGKLSVYSGLQSFKVVDTTAPKGVTIMTPANGSMVSSLSSIGGSASDDAGGSGIKSVILVLHRLRGKTTQYWDGGTWTATPTYLHPVLSDPGAVSTDWSLASNKLPAGADLPTGRYYLRAWAYDEGNLSVYSGLQSFDAGMDATAPLNVTITAPANGATVSALTAIGGSAQDNEGGSGIKSVSVVLHRIVGGATQYWNGSAWGATASYLYPTLGDPDEVSTDWSLPMDKLPADTNLPAGTYYLRAWAYDGGNRSVYSGLQSFTVGAEGMSFSSSPVKLQDVSGIVSSSRIVLVFEGGLRSAEASDASHYAVTVGGVRVKVLSASYASSTHRVTLQLPDGALRSGGEIVVGYRDLHDTQGNALEQAAYAVEAE
jgi:CSLREA domain-containing protein